VLDSIDKFLLDKVFEPISDWVHHTFGIGVYTLTRLVLLVTVALLFAHVGVAGLETLIKRPLLFLDSIIVLVVLSVLSVKAAEYEDTYHKRLSDKLPPNLRTPGSIYFRQVSIVVLLVNITPSKDELVVEYWIGLGVSAGITIGAYFLACRPRPPRSKKVTKLKALPV